MSRILLVLALCGIIAAPVHAQVFSDKESIGHMYWYGGCIAELAPSQSRRVLSFPPGSKEERALLRKISTDRCISGEVQVLRGFLAKAAYRQAYAATHGPQVRPHEAGK
jgi:hypothetical protein